MDLFVVPTIGFKLLYGFVIVRLDRRDLVWINVTTNPTAEWVARQITEAFPWDEAPRYMIRDRDRIYGAVVTRRLRAMGIRDKPIAPASPWQNGFAERLIGSIRHECFDHVIVLGEAHLRRILKSYADYYNDIRTHRSLNKDAPDLSAGSAVRSHHFERHLGRTSSPLRSDLGFRYTQASIKALSVAPEFAVAHLALGIVHILTNHAAEGIAECEQALALDRNLAEAHACIGWAKFLLGRGETEAQIHEALRLSPRDIGAFRWMMFVGIAKSQFGADAEAVVWLRRSIDANRNMPYTHFNLAAAPGAAGAVG